MSAWDERASVRSAPSRISAVETPLFPPEFVPVLQHGRLLSLNEGGQQDLRAQALHRFMNFTHKLELLVVNAVTLNIAMGRYDVPFGDDVRLDAHKIYVDEAYHGLFSFQMMLRSKERYPLLRFEEGSPSFLREFAKTVADMPANRRALAELTFVIVSEMLITSTLHDAAGSDGIDAGVQNLLKDHARDEARHHGFYSQILRLLWRGLRPDEREWLVVQLPKYVLTYCRPDTAAITQELLDAGLSQSHAEEAIGSTYSEQVVADYAIRAGNGLFSFVRENSSPLEQDILDNEVGSTMNSTQAVV